MPEKDLMTVSSPGLSSSAMDSMPEKIRDENPTGMEDGDLPRTDFPILMLMTDRLSEVEGS